MVHSSSFELHGFGFFNSNSIYFLALENKKNKQITLELRYTFRHMDVEGTKCIYVSCFSMSLTSQI